MENKDFNIAKFLKENKLGSYGMLRNYVDLKPLKEEEDGAYDDQDEVPYQGSDDNLTGQGDDDSFEQDEIISEAPMRIEWEDLDHTDISGQAMEMDIIELIDRVEESIQIELTNDATVSQMNPENPMQTAAQIRLLIKKLWLQKIQEWSATNRGMNERFGDDWHPENTDNAPQTGTEEDVLAAMITALQDAGFSKQEIEQLSHTISNDPSVLDFGDF